MSAYQAAKTLVKEVYALLKKFPKEEQYVLYVTNYVERLFPCHPILRKVWVERLIKTKHIS